jgi:hypothetical protein
MAIINRTIVERNGDSALGGGRIKGDGNQIAKIRRDQTGDGILVGR